MHYNPDYNLMIKYNAEEERFEVLEYNKGVIATFNSREECERFIEEN